MAHVHPAFPPAPVPHQPSPLGFGFAFPRGSHYAPPSPGGGGSTSSFGTPLRRSTTTTGPAFSSPAFPTGTAQYSPSAVGFGFGGGGSPAGPSSAAGHGAHSPARPSSHFHRQPSSTAGSPAPTASTSNRRRGRDDLSDDSDDDDSAQRETMRPMRGLKKSRMDPFGPDDSAGRRGDRQQGSSAAGTSSASSTSADGSPDEPDLGVMLALLPQTSLLPILTSLIQRHPQLKPDLLALLPQPSLSVALDALRTAEAKIRSAVPFGWDAQRPGGGVSEHYVVGRVSESVSELASLIQSHLPIFLPSSSAATSTNPGRPPPHPTDQFSYLQQATALLLRLSTSLPALPGFDILWSRLAREWVRWTDTVARWVNHEGGMVGAGVADGWVRELDLLVGPPTADASKPQRAGVAASGAAKIRAETALVRERWVRECGWLVGRRVPHQHIDIGMDEEEEL